MDLIYYYIYVYFTYYNIFLKKALLCAVLIRFTPLRRSDSDIQSLRWNMKRWCYFPQDQKGWLWLSHGFKEIVKRTFYRPTTHAQYVSDDLLQTVSDLGNCWESGVEMQGERGVRGERGVNRRQSDFASSPHRSAEDWLGPEASEGLVWAAGNVCCCCPGQGARASSIYGVYYR